MQFFLSPAYKGLTVVGPILSSTQVELPAVKLSFIYTEPIATLRVHALSTWVSKECKKA